MSKPLYAMDEVTSLLPSDLLYIVRGPPYSDKRIQKSNLLADLDTRYYTETEVNALLAAAVTTANAPHGCTLTRTTNQALGAGAVVLITWPNEILDAEGYHAVSSGDIVIPTGLGGIYAIAVQGACSGGISGEARLSVNGVGYFATLQAISIFFGATLTVPAAAGNIIQFNIWNNSGALNVTSARIEVWKVQ